MAMASKIPAWNRRIRATRLDPDAFREFGQVIQNPATHDMKPELDKTAANQGSATKWLDVTQLDSHYELARTQKAAKPVINMFVCEPRELEEGRFPVRILERHPFTPQTFIPLGLAKDDATYYLVIVAPTLPVATIMTTDEKNSRNPPYPRPPPRRRKSLRERLLGGRPNPFTNDFAPSTTPVTATSAQKPKGAGLPDLENIRAFIARGDQAVTYGPGTWHAPMVVLGEKAVEFVVVQYASGVAIEDCQEVAVEAKEGKGLEVEVYDAPRAKL